MGWAACGVPCSLGWHGRRTRPRRDHGRHCSALAPVRRGAAGIRGGWNPAAGLGGLSFHGGCVFPAGGMVGIKNAGQCDGGNTQAGNDGFSHRAEGLGKF